MRDVGNFLSSTCDIYHFEIDMEFVIIATGDIAISKNRQVTLETPPPPPVKGPFIGHQLTKGLYQELYEASKFRSYCN